MQLNKQDWQAVSFGDVVSQGKGTVDPETSGLERYVAGEHMVSEDLHIRQWGTVGDGYLGPAFHRPFETGDILYGSRRTYLKKVAVADFDGITSNTTFVIKENLDLVVPGLIPFLMLSDRFTEHSVKNSKGSVNPYINFKDITKFEFRLPPIEQQIKLTDLLLASDELGEKYRIQLLKLYGVKNSLLEQTYDDAERDSVPLSDIGRWLSGGTPNRARPEFWNGDIPWASPKDMKTDWLGKTQEAVTESGAKAGSALLPVGTLLMVVRGMILAHTFPVALTTVPMSFNQDMKALIVSEDHNPLFVFYFLKYMADYVLSNTAESSHGTKRVPTEIVTTMMLPVYTEKEEKDFLNTMQKLESAMSDIIAQIDANNYLKQRLINQIFSA